VRYDFEKRYHRKESLMNDDKLSRSKIIKRLEIIKNLILLNDTDLIPANLEKISYQTFSKEIENIKTLLESKEYSEAISLINDFTSRSQKLVEWIDPDLLLLEQKINALSIQINQLDNEKSDLNKIIYEFHYQHSKHLGELILRILKLKKEKYKSDDQKYQEAKNDENEYRDQYNEEINKSIIDLTEKERIKLKEIFRQATKLCHPDIFSDDQSEIKEQAEEIFKELNQANKNNDVTRVNEILNHLKQGSLLFYKSNKSSDKDILVANIKRLELKIEDILSELIDIKQSDTYKLIMDIDDWGSYFVSIKKQLNIQLSELKSSINSV